jgi:hypothetical protein
MMFENIQVKQAAPVLSRGQVVVEDNKFLGNQARGTLKRTVYSGV